jgi:hypothetical protein
MILKAFSSEADAVWIPVRVKKTPQEKNYAASRP